MSNNKQTMKLYTEEQVRQIFENLSTANGYDYNMDTYCDSLTPISLPSDEEIEEALSYRIVEQISFRKGAKWMRDKIHGGNK